MKEEPLKLDLIKITDEHPDYPGWYYWFMDKRFNNDKDGAFINSIAYKTQLEAIEALANNKLKFDVVAINN